MVSERVSNLGELVEHQVLHEVGLHVVENRHAPVHEVHHRIMPGHHLRHGGLCGKGLQHVEVAVGRFADQHGGLVVGGGGVLEGGVGVAHQLPVLPQREHFSVPDVLCTEDGALGHRVVHILFLEVALAGEIAQGTDLFEGVVLAPRWFPFLVKDVDHGVVDARSLGDAGENGILGDAVAHEDEPAASRLHCPEQCRQHPFGGFAHTLFVEHHLIVVNIVDDDVVGSPSPVLDATGRLAATERGEVAVVGGGELAFRPVALLDLLAEVVNVEVVVRQFLLKICEEARGGILAFPHQHHCVELPLRLDLEPQGDEHAHVGGLGVATCPLENGACVAVAEYVGGCIQLELATGSACDVREIGADKEGVVALRPLDAHPLRLLGFGEGAGASLEPFAVKLPLLVCFGFCDVHR